MRCHYEVLDVPRTVSSEELTKTYRKLALKYHPDKNLENIEEATEKFKELQQAYDVLSDPQERAFYDAHREHILSQGPASDYEDPSLDVFQYFNSSCYSGYNDDKQGFYTVYGEIFTKIAAEDMEYYDIDKADFRAPLFGRSDSSYDEVVHEFYAYWLSYCTSKPYAWKDEYDLRTAPNRRVLRLMEKENKKLRDQMRKKRNEEVRALAAFVRKRDKRVQAYKKKLEEKAAENVLKAKLNRKKQLEERQRQLEGYQESHWTSMANLEHELKQIETSVTHEFKDGQPRPDNNGNEEDGESEDEIYDILYCVACDKHFKTEKAFSNHENSKKHKENITFLKMSMTEEEKNFQTNGTDVIHETDEHLDAECISEEEISESKSRNRKKKKTKQVQAISTETDSEVEDAPKASFLEMTADEEPGKPIVNGTEDKLPVTENLTDEEISENKTRNKKKKRNRPAQGGPSESANGLEQGKDDASKDEKEVDVKVIEERTESPPAASAQQTVPKLKGKKAKDAKRKAKLESVTSTPPTEGNDEASRRCVVCGTIFSTRNKMFDHLKETGHAIVVPKSDSQRSIDPINSKRNKKRK